MERYFREDGGEVVILKSFPCRWGKCKFCNFSRDSSLDVKEIEKIDLYTLNRVEGNGYLKVFNSASFFEFPFSIILKIAAVIKNRNIIKLYVESRWEYRNYWAKLENEFGIPCEVRLGVESFDDYVRNKILNKNENFTADEVAKYTDSIYLLVGFKGQSKASVSFSINEAKKYFKNIIVNIYTEIKERTRDENLIKWFQVNYGNDEKLYINWKGANEY